MTKLHSVLLAVVVLTAYVIMSTSASPYLFAEFQRKYNKYYGFEDYQARYNIFMQNLEAAAALNVNQTIGEGYDASSDSADKAEYGINQFSDLTPEEFRAQFLLPPNALEGAVEALQAAPMDPEWENRRFDARDIPTSFDWRNNPRTVISRVYNQGGCGSCWAWSVMESVESMWALAGNPLPSLSAQQLVDCDSGNSGCGGGWPTRAYSYVLNAGGIQTAATYPYRGNNGQCRFDRSQVAASITGYTTVTKNNDEAAMATFVATKGPLSVCLDSSTWQYYKGGVITTSSNCGTQLNHCVMVTGYDVTASGTPVWIVRNQWGTGFGNNGYMMIQRGANVCGIASIPTAAKVPGSPNPVPNPTPVPTPNPNPFPTPVPTPGPNPCPPCLCPNGNDASR